MRFVVVSDIYDYPTNMDWLQAYGTTDCLILSDLCDRPTLKGADLHKYLFEQGGLEQVALRLSQFSGEKLHGLGYSAGGTALWRAVREGLNLKRLVCVSSTRLRYERASLTIPTHTFWGERDLHRPDEDWCRLIPSYSHIYEGLEHDFYHQTGGLPDLAHQADLVRALTN